MCGLTGIFGSTERSEDELRKTVAGMTAALRHRGPDADGVWADGGMALGHSRLSILDLSPAGAQPMHSACGRFFIAFNGEIYNHLEIRDKLSAAGAAPDWRGHSDTSARMPLDMKIRGGQGKWVLRQILYQHVPRELIERPKTGFSIPISEWLRGPLRQWAEDLLSPAALAKDNLLDPEPILAAWAEYLSHGLDWVCRLGSSLTLPASHQGQQ